MIGAVNVGDSDRIVRFLTADEGRVSLMVRRARASKKRWGGALQIGNRVRLQCRLGRGDLGQLQGADLVATPNHARKTLEGIALLTYGCELVACLAPERQPALRPFTLLCTWLDVLECMPGPGAASRVALDAKALTFAGLAPALVQCARCGLPLTGQVVFDPAVGGGQHRHCGQGRAVPASALATMDVLRRTPLMDTRTMAAPPDAFQGLLTDFVEYQVRKEVRSRHMLEDVLGSG